MAIRYRGFILINGMRDKILSLLSEIEKVFYMLRTIKSSKNKRKRVNWYCRDTTYSVIVCAFTNRYCSEINDNTATLEEQIDAPRKLPSGMKTVTVDDEN